MKTIDKHMKTYIIADLQEVVEAINRSPSCLGDDAYFWRQIEKLNRATALISCLPEHLVASGLASNQCLTTFNELMTDWAEDIVPMGGWDKDLLARVPAESLWQFGWQSESTGVDVLHEPHKRH